MISSPVLDGYRLCHVRELIFNSTERLRVFGRGYETDYKMHIGRLLACPLVEQLARSQCCTRAFTCTYGYYAMDINTKKWSRHE